MPWSGIVGSYGNSIANIWGPAGLFSKATLPLYISTSNVWGFQFLHIFANTYYYCLLYYSHPSGYEVVSSYGFSLYFPNGYWGQNLFACDLFLTNHFRCWRKTVLKKGKHGCKEAHLGAAGRQENVGAWPGVAEEDKHHSWIGVCFGGKSDEGWLPGLGEHVWTGGQKQSLCFQRYVSLAEGPWVCRLTSS